MKFFLRTFLSFLSFSLFLFFNVSSVNAEVIQSFDSQITAHQDGTFDVVETIIYDFENLSKHGIFRDIPTVTKVGDLFRVTEIIPGNVTRDGNSEKYSINKTGNLVTIKIGDPNKTINKSHTYVISYKVKNGIGSNFEDHDELFWNITGNDWQVPIIKASASLRTDFGVTSDKVACYTGLKGSTEKSCFIQETFPEKISTNKILQSNEGLSVGWRFPVGSFPKSILRTDNPGIKSEIDPQTTKFMSYILVASIIFLNLILAPYLIFWYLTKKRKKSFGPPVANFDFPEDQNGKRLSPAEAGIIDTTKLERDDVTATIFDLAIRKYLKIEQSKNEKVLGVFGSSEKNFKLKKLNDGDDLVGFEKILFDRFFESEDEIKIDDLKTDFYKTFQKMDKEVFSSLILKKIYTKNPAIQKGFLIAGGITSLVTANLLLAIVLFFLSSKLNGRTTIGDEIDYKIDGLKLFLKNMSRNYKWQADQLYIVEKMIPYAMALGYIDKFMEQLKVSFPDYKPDWYSGNLAFYSINNSLISSMNSGITTHAPSSSSGFSGGGFSGGGGGGGGGGSW